MPRFSIKDLLLATTLIALGIGALMTLARTTGDFHRAFPGTAFVLFLGGGALIGAGLLAPASRPLAGAVIGALVQAAFVAFAFITDWMN